MKLTTVSKTKTEVITTITKFYDYNIRVKQKLTLDGDTSHVTVKLKETKESPWEIIPLGENSFVRERTHNKLVIVTQK